MKKFYLKIFKKKGKTVNIDNIIKNIGKGLFFLFLLGSLNSCHIYSFTGASLPPEVKTFSIKTFSNQASMVYPSLSEKLTEKLKDKFMREMSLKLVEDNADINFNGIITDYSTAPSGIGGQEKATTNRLTIKLQVKFENTKDSKADFDTGFSEYADFSSSLNLSSVESDLVDQITDKLVLDIFNRAVNNW